MLFALSLWMSAPAHAAEGGGEIFRLEWYAPSGEALCHGVIETPVFEKRTEGGVDYWCEATGLLVYWGHMDGGTCVADRTTLVKPIDDDVWECVAMAFEPEGVPVHGPLPDGLILDGPLEMGEGDVQPGTCGLTGFDGGL